MTRTRYRWPLGIVVLLLLASKPVLAVSPSYIMFYGDQLAGPVVLGMTPQVSSEFLWSYGRRSAVPDGLDGRPYLKYAVFWGRWSQVPVDPALASQHGRFYLPTTTQPGAVAITPPDMDSPGHEHPPAHPIPETLAGFWRGWVLTADEIAQARDLGVPRVVVK